MKYLKNYNTVFIIIILFSNTLKGQAYNSEYSEIVNNCSYNNIQVNLQAFENLGIKELGTTALANTKSWIIDKYTNYGYTDIVEDEFTALGHNTSNIIITKVGTIYPDKFLIIDAHYDTKNGPGTDDNGSGTVTVLEIAKLLANVDTKYSIKFIHFSGEEDGLLGSKHYVTNVVNSSNLDILLVFNIDGIGGVNGMVNNTIVCERDEDLPNTNNSASANVTNQLANCVSLYSNLSTEISYAYASDYIPFEDNNEIITGFYEKNESLYAHTVNDILSNLDVNYVYEVTKAAIGASLHFANDYNSSVGIIENSFSKKIVMYPNPTNGKFTVDLGNNYEDISIIITDINGKVIKNANYSNCSKLDLKIESKTGLYFLKIKTKHNATIFKIIKN